MDSKGREYTVNYQSNKNGFREYGGANQDSIPKILFIGDSFTQAAEVSNGTAFYNVFQNRTQFQIFAFGVSGYGTLQEFLVFQKYFDKIKPDIILWQLCTNDFIDNGFELEKNCQYKNQKRRPYLSNSKIEYHNSERKIYNFLTRNSSLLFNLGKLLEKVKRKLKIDNSGEALIVTKGKDYKHFKIAYNNTDELIKRIKSVIGNKSKLVMFCADSYEPQLSFIKEIIKKNEIHFIEDNIHRLNEANRDGKTIYCYDNVHWNEYGHYVVGNSIVDALKRNKIIE